MNCLIKRDPTGKTYEIAPIPGKLDTNGSAKIRFYPVRHIPGGTQTAMDWILATWGDPHKEGKISLHSRITGVHNNPEALLAVCGQAPVGIVTFRRFDVAKAEKDALWIDTLFVAPPFRGNGTGTQLIEIAEKIAALSDDRIYVFTALPELYELHRWSRVSMEPENENWILTKELKSLTAR